MAETAPLLFDRSLVRGRLARAAAGPYPTFLIGRAAEDLADRLAAVRRDFDLALDLGTPTMAAVAVLRAHPGIGRTVRMAGGGSADVVGDEESLPFGPGRFGLAVSLLAFQAVNDLPGTLAQLRTVLRPDGLLLGCLLAGESLRELRLAFAEAEGETARGASPRVAPFADIRALGGLLQRAGFALPVVDLDRVTVRYPDMFGLMADLRAMGFGNALAERSRAPLRRATLLRAAAVYAERFADPDGRVRATFDLAWMSGWVPHASQQTPLKPGSAQRSLANALAGVDELKGEKP